MLAAAVVTGTITVGGKFIEGVFNWCSGGDYDSVNRRFEFTFKNSTGIALTLMR
jgi:hypothetical protein